MTKLEEDVIKMLRSNDAMAKAIWSLCLEYCSDRMWARLEGQDTDKDDTMVDHEISRMVDEGSPVF